MSDQAGESVACEMNAGEAVYQVIRVFGPMGSADALSMVMEKLDQVRASCPDARHRPPILSREQVQAIADALVEHGCISTEGNWKDAPIWPWTETRSEAIDERVAFARTLQIGGPT